VKLALSSFKELPLSREVQISGQTSGQAPSPAADSPAVAPDFERALGELESLVERLERGDLPLEDALKTFERGVQLTRHCQSSLKAAQQKVEILLKRSGQTGIEAFNVPDDGAASAAQE
jgi:exodeoxyribonuclease VII small subunit